MSEFLGEQYNFDVWKPSGALIECFKTVAHAGDLAPDFSLPTLSGQQIRLPGLRGKPVVMEFGSIS